MAEKRRGPRSFGVNVHDGPSSYLLTPLKHNKVANIGENGV
jgi:hypothetical protein